MAKAAKKGLYRAIGMTVGYFVGYVIIMVAILAFTDNVVVAPEIEPFIALIEPAIVWLGNIPNPFVLQGTIGY